MHQASAPVFLRALSNLRAVLEKGEAWAKEKNVAPEVLLQTRLTPDMLPLVRQVQIAADMGARGVARLGGVDVPKFEDNETTFAQVYDRIARASDYIGSVPAAQVDGSEEREIVIPGRDGEMKFSGRDFLLHFVQPNLFFHCSIAYAILRESGVALGKSDFMGK
jgi:hypothetical protein